jgi:hypothetical protein
MSTTDRSGTKNPNWKGGPVEITCIGCGCKFAASYSRRNAKYCSLNCWNAEQSKTGNPSKGTRRKQWVVKSCRECGSSFEHPPAVAKATWFCKPDCQFKWRSKRMSGEGNPNFKDGRKAHCLVCGSAYERNHSKRKYCSVKCARKTRTGANAPCWKGGAVEKQCQHCGNVFRAPPRASKNRRYCSINCASKHFNKNRVIRYRDGKYPGNWRSISERIRIRDGRQCWNPACIHAVTESTRLVVHHINYNKSDCSPENLMTVCESCNARVNGNRTLWMTVLSGFNRRRLLDGQLLSDTTVFVNDAKIYRQQGKRPTRYSLLAEKAWNSEQLDAP